MDPSEQIRNALSRGCHLLEDRDYEGWSRTFSEDAIYEAYSSEWNDFGQRVGRDAILKWILGWELATLPDLNRCFALVNVVVDVGEDKTSATVASDVVMLSQYGNEPWTTRVGRYYDRLVLRDDDWLVAFRRVEWRQGNRLVDVQPDPVSTGGTLP